MTMRAIDEAGSLFGDAVEKFRRFGKIGVTISVAPAHFRHKAPRSLAVVATI